MNLSRLTALFAVVALVFSANAMAQETSDKQCTQCPKSSTALTSAQQEEGQCPVMTAAMKKLPKMTYQIGDETTCCSESAAKLAKKHSMPIHYVVAEKTYEDQGAAFTALVEETESFVNDFVTPKKCDESGKTTVAGHSCNCPVSSAAFAKKVKAATEAVSMKYKVGEETCNCPKQAAAIAKKGDQKVEYVVGEQCTPCQLTARLNLAHAKYRAAVAAITEATTQTESSEQGS